MREKHVSYRQLFRVVSIILFLGAFFFAFRIAMIPSSTDGTSYTHPLIQMNISETFFLVLHVGIVLYLFATGLICLSLSIRKPGIAYWGIQGAIWLIGISLWYQSNTMFNPFPMDAIWIVITTVVSFILLAFYHPVTLMLKKITNLLMQREVQVKDDISWTQKEPPLQGQEMHRRL